LSAAPSARSSSTSRILGRDPAFFDEVEIAQPLRSANMFFRIPRALSRRAFFAVPAVAKCGECLGKN
jgi:hypothetical protein